jgi:hypothetical protein
MAIATGTALLGAAALGVGGSLLGASAQKKSIKQANQAQQQNTAANNALARENRDVLTGLANPYNQVGLGANNALAGQMAAGPYNGGQINSSFVNSAMNPGSLTDFMNSTGYNFRMQEGQNALQTGYAAKGALQSGAAMKDLTRFGQDFASNEYGKYIGQLDNYTRYTDAFANQERGYKTDQHNNYLNLLLGQQGVGLSAVNALSGANTSATNAIMANNNQGAAAASNAALARGNANAGMYAGIAGSVGNALGYYAPGFGGYGG